MTRWEQIRNSFSGQAVCVQLSHLSNVVIGQFAPLMAFATRHCAVSPLIQLVASRSAPRQVRKRIVVFAVNAVASVKASRLWSNKGGQDQSVYRNADFLSIPLEINHPVAVGVASDRKFIRLGAGCFGSLKGAQRPDVSSFVSKVSVEARYWFHAPILASSQYPVYP